MGATSYLAQGWDGYWLTTATLLWYVLWQVNIR